jgi:hypothetical protein
VCIIQVIADLSEHNANVFYELAIRHALRKPYVQIIHKDYALPFDLSVTRTVFFDHHDLDDVELKTAELIDHISAVSGKSDVDSPISNAIDVEQMRRSGNPEQRQTVELLQSVTQLRQELINIGAVVVSTIKRVRSEQAVGVTVPPPNLYTSTPLNAALELGLKVGLNREDEHGARL